MYNRSVPKFRNSNKGMWLAGVVVTAILGSLYPVFVYPYFNIKQYQEAQKANRAGIDQDKIQPGNMRVWSDPFAPLPDKK